MGNELLQAREFAAAIEQFHLCLKFHPEWNRCHWELGWAGLASLDLKLARQHWGYLEREAPTFPELSDALKTLSEYEGIDRESRRLEKKAPRAPHGPPRKQGPGAIRLIAVGDTMIGTDYPDASYLPQDPSLVLAGVKAELARADIRFANYEGTVCDGGETDKCPAPVNGVAKNCYAFRTPTSFVKHLQDAGFNLLSMANNHAADFGEACRAQEEATFTTLGIPWSGRVGTTASMTIGEGKHATKVAMAAFHSAPHCNSTLELDRAAELVEELKEEHDIVIVSFHGGAEGFKALHVPKKKELFFGEDRGDVYRFAHRVIDAGASLVLGSGPHVVRAMEFYKGRLIAYSLGNFATYKRFNLGSYNGVGMMLEVTLSRRGKFQGARILPTWQKGEGIPELDPDHRATRLVRWLSHQDFPKTSPQITRGGRILKRGAH